jgi:hypothetical protein
MSGNACFDLGHDEIGTPEFGVKIRECQEDDSLLDMMVYHTARVLTTAPEDRDKWLETLWFLFGHFALTRRYLLYFFVKSLLWKMKGWKPGLRDHVPPVYGGFWERIEEVMGSD